MPTRGFPLFRLAGYLPMHHLQRRCLQSFLATCLVTALTAAARNARADDTPQQQAAAILQSTGVTGGLVVHLGCGEGAMAAALRAGDSFLVHGLDRSAANVDAARRHVRQLGCYGPVSVDTFDGVHLPYADETVNLLVAEQIGDVPRDEINRVLAPQAVAYVKQHGQWTKTVKPWPDEIDQWTHYLHDASNNAVAHDERVGPPRHLQWQSGPRWSRHHDHMASMSAMVAGGGRVFYVLDEGSRVSPQLPSAWKLIARDAFNGVLLWKRSIARWHDSLWPLKSGPASLPRRLVAGDDTVYATLGIAAPVSALDMATGKTLREYAGSDGTEEILLCGEVLLTLVNRTPVNVEADLATDPEQGRSRDSRTTYSPKMAEIWAGIRSTRWTHAERAIRAYDAASGRLLWEHAGRVIPLTLGADDENVYFHDGRSVVALTLANGQSRWTSEPVPVWEGLEGRGLQSWFAPTLVVHGDTVLFAGGEKMHMSYMGWGAKDIGDDTMTALSTETGKRLWTAPHPYSGYNSPEDLFVAGGKVWTGVTAKSGPGGRYTGRDLRTGEVVDDFPPTVQTHWFHHRCYRAKATDKFILSSRTGIEFVDLDSGQWDINHWVRGGCLYGIMPSAGLVYAPAHPCACYPEAKLNGFTALAAASASRAVPETLPGNRLQRGPAYGDAGDEPATDAAWPAYRHDATRSGGAAASIAPKLLPAWQAELGGKLSQPIVAAGRVYIANADRHAVTALDADSGQTLWTFVAGGRVDSPPTFDRGRLLFGAADGYVYCVRASDGLLAWRFRVAPVDRRIVAFEQLESLWPLPGSVLVQDGVATVVAGRSMFLDDGLRLSRLDAATGRLLSERTLDEQDPQTGHSIQSQIKGLNMPVALPDILSSDGQQLFMRSQTMDLHGNRQSGRGGDHLFAPYGFTDDSWFHRTYWLFGDGFQGGVGGFRNGQRKPAGRILVNNASTVFGYGRKPEYYRWSSVIDYQLYAAVRPGGDTGLPAAVYFENSPSLNPQQKLLSIAAWVKTDADDGTILVRGANLNGFALTLADRKPRMLLRTGGKTHETLGERPIGDDWTHVAGVLDARGRMQVYVDGELAGSTTDVPLLSGEPSIAMKVGCDDTHQLLPRPLPALRGALDEVMLLHRPLSAEEVQRLARREKLPGINDDDALVLHLSFAGGKTRDRSGHNNHGRIAAESAAAVEGPVGEALALVQPKHVIAPPEGGRGTNIGYRWRRDVPLMVRAMALAGDVLLVAGPPDVLDEDAAFQDYPKQATQQRLAAQQAALNGAQGALLHAVDASNGQTLAEHTLDALPVFDGLSVAGGRAFIATTDGRVICMEPAK